MANLKDLKSQHVAEKKPSEKKEFKQNRRNSDISMYRFLDVAILDDASKKMFQIA